MDIRSLLTGESEAKTDPVSYAPVPTQKAKPNVHKKPKVEPAKKSNSKKEESEEDEEDYDDEDDDEDESDQDEGSDAVLYYNIVTTKRAAGKRKIKPRDFV